MPPSTPRLRILSVGGNAVSAFLSWRLSATNACDVTLVWKSGFEAVAQYGISFKSAKFGNERFKPRHVVRSPEEAAGLSRASYDYVILCVKALPDVYDLASVIESVVAPQHTCILVNTTSSLGIETYLEQRFPTNVVLSLVSGAELAQISSSEFEHKGSSELWVGAANKNPAIPASIQQDMAEALSMTLKSGSVECEVSQNIRQQQYERMVGPIAFHPASVLFETPSHSELLEKPGVRQMITGIMDEAINLAQKQGCAFSSSFKQQTLEQMLAPADSNSIMYQDFIARRPMEVETFLGSPLKQAQELGMALPRIETLYALLHNINVINQSRPQPAAAQPVSPAVPQQPPPRMSSAPNGGMPKGGMYGPGPMARPPMGNGMRPGSRAPSAQGGPPPGRRGPSMNGYPRMSSNGYGQRGPPPPTHRRPSFEGNDLEEFSHLILYDNHDDAAGYDNMPSANGDLALRERELAIRQKELALREQEYSMRRRGPGRMQSNGYDDDDEEGEDYFDAVATHPPVDENFDMMSVTSRRTRKTPSATQLRANPEMMGMPPSARNSRGWRPQRASKNRASASIMADMPGLREELMGNPLVGYSSDRYATVDRMNMGNESRTNSLTMERLNDIHRNGMQGPYPGQPPMSRRGSQSPGNPLGPNGRQIRPSPPNGYAGPPPPPHNGRPSDPNMRQPVPRHPPGHGNNISPQDVENQAGVSSRNPYPPKSGSHVVRSLTGSASASQGSGDSNRSAPLDSSEPSAHSSSSSLQVRQSIGVR